MARQIVVTLMYAIFVTSWYSMIPVADGGRILAVSPINGMSHWNMMRGILRALTDHGHHVTVFTPNPDGARENYTEVDLSLDMESFTQNETIDVTEYLSTYIEVEFVHRVSRYTCKRLYRNRALKRLMDDPSAVSDFDVVFVELMASECVSYLSFKLGVPLVYVTPPPLVSYVERSVFGHDANPAVVSHMLGPHGKPRTFADRFSNTVTSVYSMLLLRFKIWYSGTVDDQQPFDLVEPVKPSIVFSNAHYISDAARPLPPNVIPVGGIHLDRPKTIPDDILEFIENSPNGVIFFTLGSIIKISTLPEHIKGALIDVLGKVPQRVLLKYEGEIVNKPKNIMIKKWFPQRDILVHPNIKLFISHGGISGVYEAVDAGVPVLGFPVFFDQYRNLDNLECAGMAISMKLKSVTKDSFLAAILELISDEKYKKNAKIASELFKDRPMTPAMTVDYWTRYVIRHKGAPHLKSHALTLKWYQYLLLDVIAALALIFLLVAYVTYLVSKTLYKYFIFKFGKVKAE